MRMSFVVILMLPLLSVALSACGAKSKSASNSRAGTITTDGGEPEGGVETETPEEHPGGTGLGSLPQRPAPAPTDDERTLAPFAQDPPTLDASLDPRTFEPKTDYVPGAGKFQHLFAKGKLAVADDGASHVHPACANALPFHSEAELTPVVDGALSEWTKDQVVAIDRLGDGFVDADGRYDLRTFYFAQDASSYYLAIELADDWPRADDTRLQLFFDTVLPPTENGLAQFEAARSLAIFGDEIREWDLGAGQFVTLTGPGFAVATQGRTIEVKIARSELAPYLIGPHMAVRLDLYNGKSAQPAHDFMAAHLTGFVDDYACLVPMPGKTTKMFVFRREDEVEARDAEIAYRAMVAAAPAVESAMGDRYDFSDVVSVTITKAMAASGTYTFPNSAIFLKQRLSDVYGDNGPLQAFKVAAHEYGHGLNLADYRLDPGWHTDGHSELVEARAAASYYGDSVAQEIARSGARTFVTHEAESWRGLEPWTGSPYQYAKAHAFYENLSNRLPYADFLRVLKNRQGALLDALTQEPAFVGEVSAGMWSGWLSGTYETALFRPETVLDADGDGLVDYLEVRAGTDASKPDTNGDGVGDGIERALAVSGAAAPAWRADNVLDDWASLGDVATLKAVDEPLAEGCGAQHDMKRVGVVFDGDWLVVGVELGAAVAGKTGAVVAFIDEPGAAEDVNLQVKASYGRDLIFAFRSRQLLKPERMGSEFNGKTVELHYHRAWLGWGKAFPVGTTVSVATYSQTDGTGTVCESTGSIVPEYP